MKREEARQRNSRILKHVEKYPEDTQAEVARRFKVTQQYVSKLMKMELMPRDRAPRRQPELDLEGLRHVAEQYDDGASLQALMSEYHCSATTIKRICTYWEVPMRSSGRPRKKRYGQDENDKNARLSPVDLASILGVDATTVTRPTEDGLDR